jgi:predicted DNA-binding protein (UPF0278 family)
MRAGVQQHDGTRRGAGQHIAAIQEVELMDADEVGRLHQIRRLDRIRPETQMRDRLRAGFLGVVDEITLGKKFRIVADDLDRVLVSADRAVRTQSEEHRPHHFIGLNDEMRNLHPDWCASRHR